MLKILRNKVTKNYFFGLCGELTIEKWRASRHSNDTALPSAAEGWPSSPAPSVLLILGIERSGLRRRSYGLD